MTRGSYLNITVLPEDPEQRDLLATDLTDSGEFEVTKLAYGWQVASFENAFTIQMTTRQDGYTAWLVTLIEIDGNARAQGRLTPTGQATRDAIAEAINQLTQHWTWPLN